MDLPLEAKKGRNLKPVYSLKSRVTSFFHAFGHGLEVNKETVRATSTNSTVQSGDGVQGLGFGV